MSRSTVICLPNSDISLKIDWKQHRCICIFLDRCFDWVWYMFRFKSRVNDSWEILFNKCFVKFSKFFISLPVICCVCVSLRYYGVHAQHWLYDWETNNVWWTKQSSNLPRGDLACDSLPSSATIKWLGTAGKLERDRSIHTKNVFLMKLLGFIYLFYQTYRSTHSPKTVSWRFPHVVFILQKYLCHV